MVNTSHQPSYQADRPLAAQHHVTTSTRGLEFANETVGGLAMYFANDTHSTDTDAVVNSKSLLNKMTNVTAMYTPTQYSSEQTSATATNAPDTYFTNHQLATTEGSETAMRGSSFVRHTMDGSFMCTDDQYPMAQTPATTMRASSFKNNTMDGSFMYTDDQYSAVPEHHHTEFGTMASCISALDQQRTQNSPSLQAVLCIVYFSRRLLSSMLHSDPNVEFFKCEICSESTAFQLSNLPTKERPYQAVAGLPHSPYFLVLPQTDIHEKLPLRKSSQVGCQ